MVPGWWPHIFCTAYCLQRHFTIHSSILIYSQIRMASVYDEMSKNTFSQPTYEFLSQFILFHLNHFCRGNPAFLFWPLEFVQLFPSIPLIPTPLLFGSWEYSIYDRLLVRVSCINIYYIISLMYTCIETFLNLCFSCHAKNLTHLRVQYVWQITSEG